MYRRRFSSATFFSAFSPFLGRALIPLMVKALDRSISGTSVPRGSRMLLRFLVSSGRIPNFFFYTSFLDSAGITDEPLSLASQFFIERPLQGLGSPLHSSFF